MISNLSLNTTFLVKCLVYGEGQHLFILTFRNIRNLQNCKGGAVAGGACGQCNIFSNKDKETQIRKLHLYEDFHKKKYTLKMCQNM
jgi:hypothetical protein